MTTKAAINAPPTIIAVLKTFPAVFRDEKPRNIKNAEKTNPIKESAFILFHRKNSRRTRRHRQFYSAVFDLHVGDFAQSVS